jgi:hypothetical protein
VKAVTLVLTPTVTAKVANDPRFKEGALLDAVEAEFHSRKLLNEKDPGASGTIEVSIGDFATRSTTNAVVLGYNLATGTLAGDVTIRGANGQELRSFQVRARTRLASAASASSNTGGENASPLGSLYRKFADMAADGVAGTTPKPNYTEDNKSIPR